MAEFDQLLIGSGQDKFLQLYNKYNDTMTALKAGSTNRLLSGNGVGALPTYKLFWETPIVVGSGGAPAYTVNFTIPTDTTISLQYRRSIISGTVSLYGRWRRINSLLNGTTSNEVLFILPVGYRPVKPTFGVCAGPDFKPVSVVIDILGNVFILNRTGLDFSIGAQSDMDITFNIS